MISLNRFYWFVIVVIMPLFFIKSYALNNVRYSVSWIEPFIVEYQGKKSTVLFFKNNLKDEIRYHYAYGEIYHLTDEGKTFNYVDNILDDEIVSVFIYEDVNYSKSSSLEVITKTDAQEDIDYYYSLYSYPIFIEKNTLKIQFFPGDRKPGTIFDNCFDGIRDGERIVCPYKDEQSIRNYFDHR